MLANLIERTSGCLLCCSGVRAVVVKGFSEGSPPLDANALVLMTLCGYHDISLIQHKHSDLLWVDELQLCAPV